VKLGNGRTDGRLLLLDALCEVLVVCSNAERLEAHLSLGVGAAHSVDGTFWKFARTQNRGFAYPFICSIPYYFDRAFVPPCRQLRIAVLGREHSFCSTEELATFYDLLGRPLVGRRNAGQEQVSEATLSLACRHFLNLLCRVELCGCCRQFLSDSFGRLGSSIMLTSLLLRVESR